MLVVGSPAYFLIVFRDCFLSWNRDWHCAVVMFFSAIVVDLCSCCSGLAPVVLIGAEGVLILLKCLQYSKPKRIFEMLEHNTLPVSYNFQNDMVMVKCSVFFSRLKKMSTALNLG